MACGKAGGCVAGVGIVGVMGFIALRYLFHPWASRWGATHAEVYGSFPGDDLVPTTKAQYTHAITIDAPASDIWPWLTQIGQGRGGFYSYDWLENVFGLDIHSADEIVPSFQTLGVGDIVRQHSKGGLEVVILEPEQDLVMYEDPDTQVGRRSELTGVPGGGPLNVVSSWSFHLRPVDSQTTRLITRSRSAWPSNAGASVLWGVLMDPVHFLMSQKMLREIKKRAEAGSTRTAELPGA